MSKGNCCFFGIGSLEEFHWGGTHIQLTRLQGKHQAKWLNEGAGDYQELEPDHKRITLVESNKHTKKKKQLRKIEHISIINMVKTHNILKYKCLKNQVSTSNPLKPSLYFKITISKGRKTIMGGTDLLTKLQWSLHVMLMELFYSNSPTQHFPLVYATISTLLNFKPWKCMS